MRALLVAVALFAAAGARPISAQEAEDTRPAPLVLAEGRGSKGLVFQLGADGLGGLFAVDFIGGLNATLVYPLADLLWVGIRPALHYLYPRDSDYQATWFHPDLAAQVNFLHHPLRVYLLATGGFSIALDSDLYPGIAHGWSASAGAGVAWKAEGPWGLFCELAFRYGSASRDQSVLVLGEDGRPRCADAQCQTYLRQTSARQFELGVLTLNIGMVYSP